MGLDDGQGLVRPHQEPQGHDPKDCDAEDPVQGGLGVDAQGPALLGRDDALDGVDLQDQQEAISIKAPIY